ncbi:HotDog domain-containing protein [Rhodotorula diobovata]|uniref:HotDog domain-containing protein n=1 Tax=Rhodotorula diobovata TaxID=5288 RepID=A0A5C5FT49_9BASI|nr:HotDog domain-containing protein [Rhodotorula diobovata]
MLVLLALAVAWIVAAFALWVSRRDWESQIQPASLCELVAVLLTINVQAVVNVLHCARWRNMQRAPRPPQDGSAVVYRYKIAPSECDEHGRMYGGELLKLIDVSAGLVAAKHAAGPCLTISADRVIFLEEVRVGDVISISSSVNRAWGSSMEIGVRVMRQSRSDPLRGETYTCHAYLTFVAKPTQPPSPHPLLAVSDFLGLTSPPTPRRAQLPEVKPQTLLEQKRYLLAGRRRAHRIQRSKADAALHSSFRDEVFRIERAVLEADKARAQQSHNREDLLANLQVEVLTEAFMRGDPDVRTEGDDLVGEIEGFVEPVRVKRAVVEAAVRKKGHGGWHAIPLPEEDVVDQAAGHSIAALGDPKQRRALEVASHVDFGDTLSMCLWIVRPQHANSKQILFGGTLMRWTEEVSTIAARRIFPSASWSSAAIDSLTFKTAVQLGEVVYVRAAVLKVYDSSVEVAAIVTCEDRNSAQPKVRQVSESFLTLVAIDPASGRPLKGVLRQVQLPDGPVRDMAASAEQRRRDRLLDKRVLQRVYA